MSRAYSSEYVEQLILGINSQDESWLIAGATRNPIEQSRWLFDQDVKIITLHQMVLVTGDGGPWNCSEMTALVLPKSCTLWSLAQADGSSKALISAQILRPYGGTSSRQMVLELLWERLQTKAAEIIGVDLDGKLKVESSSFPEGYGAEVHLSVLRSSKD